MELYQKECCCGCGICAFVCPRQAIEMKADEEGFVYPVINQEQCIDCGKCKKACGYQEPNKNVIYECYAGQSSNELLLLKSASGGVFSSVASKFLKQGAVCGAAMSFENGWAVVRHEIADNLDALEKLLGSKYVQSEMWHVLPEMERRLKNGERILFSGTPCQVDGVHKLFSKYAGKQLVTMDLICHGVPSQQMMNDYLQVFQCQNNISLNCFAFRSKEYGWGLDGVAVSVMGETLPFSSEQSSYYRLFLDGEIYRENCYQCPYACDSRAGDITIGDYWGVDKFNPELLSENGGEFDRRKGISCILVNTAAGETLLKEFGQGLTIAPVLLDNLKVQNTQLRIPTPRTKNREKILRRYQDQGYAGVEKAYQRKRVVEICVRKLKSFIPKRIKEKVKKILKKETK